MDYSHPFGTKQTSSELMAAEQLRAAKGWLPSSANIDNELPDLAKVWPRDEQGRIRWPEPDATTPGELMARARLEKFVLDFRRAFYNSEAWNTINWNTRRLFWFMQRDLKAWGRPQWEARFFDLAWRGSENTLNEEADEERAAWLEANPPPPSPAGRKPTDRTARVKLIRETINVSRQRGYAIERDGTDNLQDRIALAAAFPRDPERDTPAKWELKFGGKRGRPSVRPTFADYVMSYTDAFEEELSAALDTLRRVYAHGALPRTYSDLRAFISIMHGLGIDDITTIRLWDRASSWCKGNYDVGS